MAYHVLDDLTATGLTEGELIQLTNDDAGAVTVDEARYGAAREEADALIDGYLGARYALPLETVPTLVRRVSVQLTVHALYRRRFPEGTPEGVKADADGAMRLLRDIASGTVTLGVQPAPTVNSERAAKVVAGERVFTRTSLAGY